MKSAVVIFPGSNCDRDVLSVMKTQGLNPVPVWHGAASLPDDVDVVVLPGGFSYGDYLRCGAMAARSPIMQDVVAFAHKGGHVLGICNGFQILCEAGLLPGTLMRNQHLKFNCKETALRVEANDNAFTSTYQPGQVITLPVAHAEGNYFADDATIAALESDDQIILRYATAAGAIVPEANPNGSRANIAGISNKAKNVVGMMPHPERHADPLTGGTDGLGIFEALKQRFA